MSSPKIVITATSAISAAGVGFDQLSANLVAEPKLSTVKAFEFHELENEIPCFKVAGFDPVEILGKKGLRTKDWSTKLLMATMELACKERFESTQEDEKPGICVGTAFGSLQSIGDFLSDSIVNGVNNVNPQAFANTVINAPAGNANIRHAVRTLSSTVATGFNAGLDALVYASDYLTRGYVGSIVAGGLEEISYYALLGMLRSGVLSASGRILPLGTGADGFVAGEGCALFLLETEETARARGAAILAEIAGYATAFDPATHLGAYNPKAEAVRYVMRTACERAGIVPKDAGFVAASANGTPAGDAMEAQAVAELFGDTPVAAYKSRVGECYGASASIAVACALADMKCTRVTGTPAAYATHAGINVISGRAENIESEYAVINAFSCDGNCGSLVLRNRT